MRGLTPYLFEALVMLGVLLKTARRHDEALEVLSRALELNPNDYNAWRRKADVHRSRQDWERAAADYQRALSCGIPNPAVQRKVRLALNKARQELAKTQGSD